MIDFKKCDVKSVSIISNSIESKLNIINYNNLSFIYKLKSSQVSGNEDYISNIIMNHIRKEKLQKINEI